MQYQLSDLKTRSIEWILLKMEEQVSDIATGLFKTGLLGQSANYAVAAKKLQEAAQLIEAGTEVEEDPIPFDAATDIGFPKEEQDPLTEHMQFTQQLRHGG